MNGVLMSGSANGDYFTVPQAAKFLGLKETSVYVARHLGKIVPDKDMSWKMGRIVFAKSEIERYYHDRSGGKKEGNEKRSASVAEDREGTPSLSSAESRRKDK